MQGGVFMNLILYLVFGALSQMGTHYFSSHSSLKSFLILSLKFTLPHLIDWVGTMTKKDICVRRMAEIKKNTTVFFSQWLHN